MYGIAHKPVNNIVSITAQTLIGQSGSFVRCEVCGEPRVQVVRQSIVIGVTSESSDRPEHCCGEGHARS